MTEYWTMVNENRGYYVVWDAGDGRNFCFVPHSAREEALATYEHGNRSMPEALMYLYRGHTWGEWGSGISNRTLGTYHPRILRVGPRTIQRPQELPPFEQMYSRQIAASRASARNLLGQLSDVFRYIEPSTTTRATYGDQLRSLLILACTEVESAWKAVLAANDGLPANGRATTNHYVKLMGPMRLDEWGVGLLSYPDYAEIKPFTGWNASDPTGSLPWYDAYNDAKHNREEKLHRATLEHVISAMAAVWIMYGAQFGLRSSFDDEPLHRGIVLRRSPEWPLSDLYLPPPRNGGDLGTWAEEKLFAPAAPTTNGPK